MRFDELIRAFWDRPVYQRVFLAFTVGLFLACSARMAEADASHGGAGRGFLSDDVPAASAPAAPRG